MSGLNHWADENAVTEMGQRGEGVEEPRGSGEGQMGGEGGGDQEMPTGQWRCPLGS